MATRKGKCHVDAWWAEFTIHKDVAKLPGHRRIPDKCQIDLESMGIDQEEDHFFILVEYLLDEQLFGG